MAPVKWTATTALLLVLLAAWGTWSEAHAQSSIRLLPQFGAYTPMGQLGQFRDQGDPVFKAGRRASTLAWGLALEAGPAREGTSIRLGVGHGTNSSIPFWSDCDGCAARSTITTAGVAAVFRPIPRIVLFQPYFLAGAGIKRYNLEFEGFDDDFWDEVVEDQTQPALHLGLGTEVSLLGLRTQWELGGHLSRVRTGVEGSASEDSAFQTDLFLMLSLPFGG